MLQQVATAWIRFCVAPCNIILYTTLLQQRPRYNRMRLFVEYLYNSILVSQYSAAWNPLSTVFLWSLSHIFMKYMTIAHWKGTRIRSLLRDMTFSILPWMHPWSGFTPGISRSCCVYLLHSCQSSKGQDASRVRTFIMQAMSLVVRHCTGQRQWAEFIQNILDCLCRNCVQKSAQNGDD